jgi:CPA2 family monovalent cation:H+ antiporter-2
MISDADLILHVAELGVVFFLFIVGLELKPARLWSMRGDIFGLGASQVIVTGTLLTLMLTGLGWRLEPGLIIAFGLALSSTAFGMQILDERNDLNKSYGRKAFSILLAQDLAIAPMLAIVPLLAPDPGTGFASSGFSEFLKITFAIGAMLLAGRYLLNPFFRLLAKTEAREIMTAAALLVVLAAATLMQFAGLSMAMGAFIAGVLLADSSYRHELEANIEPFRGLLLGLFFIAVGMSINVTSLYYNWWRILLAVPVVMLVKAGVIYGLNRAFGSTHNDAVKVAVLLPQAGEFAFVLFASAAELRALWPSETSFVAPIVTLTIALTPVSVWLSRYLLIEDESEPVEEDFEGAGGTVLMIGFGRFGQMVSQVLLARNIETTIIDASADRMRQAARFGFRIYFGDGRRRDVLRAAGAEQASVICVCIDDPEAADRIVDLALAEFPNAKIYARSWDRSHTIELINKGVDFEMRETYESALVFGSETLRGLGFDSQEVEDTLEDVRRRDADRLALQLSGDILAGQDLMHTEPVEPEPLIQPERAPEPRNNPAPAKLGAREPSQKTPAE